MNHSPKFWRLVTEIMPDYQKIKKEMRGIHIY